MTLPRRSPALVVLLAVAACRSAGPENERSAFPAAAFDRSETGARDAGAARAPARVARRDPAGFYSEERDGRLWVFRTDDLALLRFLDAVEPAQSVTLVGAGPGGRSLRGPDRETLLLYLAQRPGFLVERVEDRLWVFERGSAALAAFAAAGPPAECVTLVGAGPAGETLRGPDRDTLVEYLAQSPGFHVDLVDGRLWVFPEESAELADFRAGHLPEKNVTRVGAGPLGTSLRAPDRAVLQRYLYGKPGFHVALGAVGEREFLWVFRADSAPLAEFLARGEPAESVTRIGAGPGGLTLRGPDAEVLDAYLRAR